MTNRRYTVRARHLIPCDGPPLRDACLTVDAGRISAVGDTDATSVIDLGLVAVLPGLVNAHTHLEFSDLAAPLGTPEMAFPDWIRTVIGWRGAQRRGADEADHWRGQAIQTGTRQSLTAGVLTVGEIATLPIEPLDRYTDFSGIAFLELLGLRDQTHDALLASAAGWASSYATTLARETGHVATSRPGLSPHAPYTVSPLLLQRVVRLSARQKLPVAMHLAETRDELALLRDANGPLVEMLRDVGAWQADAIPLATRPLDYLQTLSRADRTLVIHGNYLAPDEIEFMAQHRARMSIVYCPRTHAYFGHEPYPLEAMLAAGVRVVLGTDSRASNPDLDLLNEMRFVARTHPRIAPSDLVQMGTREAATALGMDARVGSLTVGKQADFVVLPLDENSPDDPYEAVLASDLPASSVFQAGVQVAG